MRQAQNLRCLWLSLSVVVHAAQPLLVLLHSTYDSTSTQYKFVYTWGHGESAEHYGTACSALCAATTLLYCCTAVHHTMCPTKYVSHTIPHHNTPRLFQAIAHIDRSHCVCVRHMHEVRAVFVSRAENTNFPAVLRAESRRETEPFTWSRKTLGSRAQPPSRAPGTAVCVHHSPTHA